MSRTYATTSTADDTALKFALAPALTPSGPDASPSFFHGFATHPRALAQALVTLADITATRYYNFVPTALRDPVLTAHGDRLRAEVFSADNGVYARLDLLGSGLDGGDISFGTTNVDIGTAMRETLSMVSTNELLHLDVGSDGLTASTPTTTATERPVQMPDRWVRAFGNAAELHTGLTRRFELSAAAARTFIASIPPATANGRSGWLVPTPAGLRVSTRPGKDAVWIDGLNRLSALKRLLVLQTGMTIYGPAETTASHASAPGGAAVEVSLPGARLLLALTESASRGYSGEGALLSALATPGVLDDAALISAVLSFEPIIDITRLAVDTGTTPDAVRTALAVLAASGRVGWDIAAGSWFHRELPDDPNRVEKDNPRLVRALGIAAKAGAVRPADDTGDGIRAWLIDGGNGVHRVTETTAGRGCTCSWHLRYGHSRGPCAHALAVALHEYEITPTPNTEGA